MGLVVRGNSHTHIGVTRIIIDPFFVNASTIHTMIITIAACKDIIVHCAAQSLHIGGSINLLVMRISDT